MTAGSRRGADSARDLRVARRHLEKGRLEKATALLQTVLSRDPECADAHVEMGAVLEVRGRRLEAMRSYHQAARIEPGHAAALLRFARLAYTSREIEPSEVILAALEASFVDAERPPLDSSEAQARDVSRLMGAQLEARHDLRTRCLAPYRDGGGVEAALIERLAADRLLRFYLAHYVNVSTGIEYAATLIRRRWLLEGPGPEGPDRLAFLASLALQCFANQYAWFETSEETAAVEILENEIAAWPGEGDGVPALERFLLHALYRPPAGLPNATSLGAAADGWPEPVRTFARAGLAEPLAERAIEAAMPRVTPIEADSEAVREQYEANPYPAWRHHRAHRRESFASFARRHFPKLRLPWLAKARKHLLVAGAGTGREPIAYADRFADLDVLAVDLSRASLAYGERRAVELGVEAVAFRQADILNLADLDQRFEVVASQGVLHHMGDPAAGLRVLVGLLAPGGLLRLGLYSERGRDIVVRARVAIAEAGLGSGADEMRRFRFEVLCQPESHPLRDLLLTGNDFFCLSGLRDFLFHVREHRYRPRDLKALLDGQGLRFLGFELSHAGKRALYLREQPGDPEMCDLDAWERFETAHPKMVEGLYRFWCCKAGEGSR